jgi:hypothetical protein
MSGPADELKKVHVRLGRQLTVREAIRFLENRCADVAAKLRALGAAYLDRPVFVDGSSGRIRDVALATARLEPIAHSLTYVRLDAR